MKMKKSKRKKVYSCRTAVVVAIVGILVAISIPIFTAQRMKAVIATNKANIRAAKAAATAEFYSNSDLLDVHNGNTLTTAAYFIYDVKEGKLSDVIKVNDKNYNGAQYNGKSCNTLGKELSNKAINGEVLDQIIVFIGNAENEMISITTTLQQFRQLPIIQMIMKLDTRVETIIHLVQTMVHLLLVDLLV